MHLCLLLLLLTAAPPVRAAGADAAELWATQPGDDPRWSQPQFDDSQWPRVDVRATWKRQGRQHYDGIVWFRAAVTLSGEARLAAQKNEVGLVLGPPAYGGYEVFAGGRRLGRSRGWSSSLSFGFPEAFRVPREVIGSDGTVRLALRVRRIAWVSDPDPESAPVGGILVLGSYPALADRLRARWSAHLFSEVPLLVLSVLFGCVFLQHLLLFRRRRQQIEHFWFALLALVFAINTFASTYWIYQVTVSRGIAMRLADMTGHLAAVFAIQFIWTFFARRISRLLRGYQLSHLALAAFVGLWPDVQAIFVTGTARWLWLLPLLVIAAVLVIQETRRGQAEARILAVGGVIMIAVELGEVARNLFHLPIDFSTAAFGFGAVIVAMSIALSLRFQRVHNELDRLRFRLEDEVLERTHALEEARDEARAADRAKSEFLANISHEIRTPMNGVLGTAELLACSSLTAEQRTHLNAIQVSSRSLLTLLNDVLDFSRLESKRLTLAQKPFRPGSVVDDCLGIMAPLAAGKGLTLNSSIADGTAEALVGDEHRTRQVLLNLLSNAIKFTHQGSVDVVLSSRRLDDGRIEARFSVSDTGSGITSDDLARLFVAFQQLDGSASRQHGGAGLGLAISKRLTELMGGSITVETVPGRGSTFDFTIVGEPATLSATRVSEPRPSAAAPPSTLRILLAEDEAINRIVILGMLQHLGYRADAVNSGVEALDAFARQTYDVVLMDIQMPGLDGLEVTQRIRSTKGDQTYIIALTAHALSGDRERCLAAGMNDYLSKPLTLADLQQALSAIPHGYNPAPC